MKRFHLLAGGLALVLALAAVGGAAARSQATTIHIVANMTAASEVPAPKGDVSSARGTFTATLTRSGTGDGQRVRSQCAREREDVRERPHEEEPGRRDPRAAWRGRAGSHLGSPVRARSRGPSRPYQAFTDCLSGARYPRPIQKG